MRKQRDSQAKPRQLPLGKDRNALPRLIWIHVQNWPTSVLLIGGFGLLIRLIYLFELNGTPFFTTLIGDAKAYDQWAQSIAGGQWIGSEVFYQTPLYPYFLAIIFKLVGHHLMAVRLVQVCLGASSCVLLGFAGKRFFNKRAGLLAALLLTIYPPAIFFDGLIQKSALDLFLVTLVIVAIGEFCERQNLNWLVTVGLALGALILNRENARILFPILIIWVLLYFRPTPLIKRVGWAAVLTLAITAVLLPVALRNYYVGHEFLISTSQLGPNLYIGNHPGARGSYEPLVPGHGNAEFERSDAKNLAERDTGRSLSPSQVSDYWVRRSLAYMRSDPGNWLRLLGRKFLLTLNANEAVDTESLEAYSEYSSVLRGLSWFGFGIILSLAAMCVWLTRKDGGQLAILYVMFIGLVVSIAIFYVVARYRYPLVPFVVLFAAGALSSIPTILSVSRKQIIPILIIGVCVAILAHLPIKGLGDETFLNVGQELVRLNQPNQALPLLQRAVSLSPNSPAPHYNLGLALRQTRDKDGSLREFNEAIRLDPNYFEAHAAKALSLVESGSQADALVEFREALRLRPESATTHVALADLLVQMGNAAEAISEYQRATELAPDLFEGHYRLAQTYVRVNQFAKAIESLQQALRITNAQGRVNEAQQIQAAIDMCRSRLGEASR